MALSWLVILKVSLTKKKKTFRRSYPSPPNYALAIWHEKAMEYGYPQNDCIKDKLSPSIEKSGNTCVLL